MTSQNLNLVCKVSKSIFANKKNINTKEIHKRAKVKHTVRF